MSSTPLPSTQSLASTPSVRVARRRRGRVLQYPVDVISVLTVVGAFGLQLAAYLMNWPWYTLLPVLLAIRELHLVEHNHAHLKIFRQTWLNEPLGWMCFISNGVAVEGYELHHVQNHHRFAQQYGGKDYDFSSTFGFEGTRFPDKPVGRVYYSLTYGLMAIMYSLIEIMRRPYTRLWWRAVCTASVFLVANGVLIWAHPWRWLWFYFVPYVAVYVSLGNNNYDHHENCEMTTPYNSARVNLRLPYRWLGFNIGYHVEHHIKPTLHWSLLPRYHDKIKQHIPPENYVIPPPETSRPSPLGASQGHT